MATILIVDDRPTNRQFLLTLLGYTAHRLLEAADGAQALEVTRAERPDLVITDILMPTMDGYHQADHAGDLRAADRGFPAGTKAAGKGIEPWPRS